jgi:hypothetical protein
MGFKDKLNERQQKLTQEKQPQQRTSSQEIAQLERGVNQEARATPQPTKTGPFSAKVQKHLEHQKQLPENRAAQALNRHTQSRLNEVMKDRGSSPSVNYLKIERLKKSKPKTPSRER